MAIETRKVGRPTSKNLSKEDLTLEIDRLAQAIQEQRDIIAKLDKEREWCISELFNRYYGLVKGQVYDLVLNGKQRQGRFVSVQRQISSYMLQREYVLKFKIRYGNGQEVIRLALPSQVIGLQALDLEELDQIFRNM
jgi:hypothetical protein